MKNIVYLRNKLLENIRDIGDGKIDIQEAEAMTNAAGKINQTVLLELKYANAKGEIPEVGFLDDAGSKKLTE